MSRNFPLRALAFLIVAALLFGTNLFNRLTYEVAFFYVPDHIDPATMFGPQPALDRIMWLQQHPKILEQASWIAVGIVAVVSWILARIFIALWGTSKPARD